MDEKFKDVVILDEDGKVDERAMKRQKIKNTLSDVWDRTKKTASDVWGWCKENREELAFMVPVFLAAATGVQKLRGGRQESERTRIDTTYYDPSTGAHWRLKRTLTNSERAELMQRRRQGEYTEDILEDMRVLR